MPLDPTKPLAVDELELILRIHQGENSAKITTLYTGEEIKSLPLASLGSALQRIVYEMLERAVCELPARRD